MTKYFPLRYALALGTFIGLVFGYWAAIDGKGPPEYLNIPLGIFIGAVWGAVGWMGLWIVVLVVKALKAVEKSLDDHNRQ